MKKIAHVVHHAGIVPVKRFRRVADIHKIVFALFLAFSPAHAAILAGTGSFDPKTNLWTYSYTIDNTAGTGPVTDFALKVFVPGSGLGFAAVTAPAGWTIGSGFSSELPPNN